MWLWNGLPNTARPIAGYLIARESGRGHTKPGDLLGIGGTHRSPGRLFFSGGSTSSKVLTGTTLITPQSWHHLVLVRDCGRVAVYLDGRTHAEISGEIPFDPTDGPTTWYFAGRSGGGANFEGKIDELSLYDRAITTQEIAEHMERATEHGLSR
jgi:hypothetical protein